MICRGAVDGYLNRELADSRIVKRLDRVLFDAMLARMVPAPVFHLPPFWYQKASFLLATKYDGYLLYLDPGLGKTKASLDVFAWRKKAKQCRRALVLVPAIENVGEWLMEAKKHRPELLCLGLEGDRADRKALVRSKADVIVATYAGFLNLVCRRRRRRDGRLGKMTMDQDKAMDLGRRYGFLVMDEIAECLASHTTRTYQALYWFAKTCRYRLGLTGTAFDNPHQVWPQFRIVDGGRTLGKTLGLFRAAFFTEKPKVWGYGSEFTFRRDMEGKLKRLMANRSFRLTSDDSGLDLPPCRGGIEAKDGPIRKDVIFTDELWAYYERIEEQLRNAEGNPTQLENAFLRMRRLTSGYVVAKTDQGDRIKVEFKTNPKLDALMAYLRRIPKGRKALVFYWYKETGDLIEKAFKKARLRYGRIDGGVAKGKRKAAKLAFQDGDLPILMGNKAIAFGLNFQAGSYVLFYETPTSPKTRIQVERRISKRVGRKGTAFIIDLVVRRSIDVKILRALMQRYDLYEAIMSGGRRKVRLGT